MCISRSRKHAGNLPLDVSGPSAVDRLESLRSEGSIWVKGAFGSSGYTINGGRLCTGTLPNSPGSVAEGEGEGWGSEASIVAGSIWIVAGSNRIVYDPVKFKVQKLIELLTRFSSWDFRQGGDHLRPRLFNDNRIWESRIWSATILFSDK